MRASLRMKRALVGTAVGAMVLGLMPASAAFAEIDYSGVCDNAGADVFPDGGTTHGDALDCMAAYGVYTGLADGTAGTFDPITREQMASLLVRFALAANEDGVLAALDLDNAADFSDVAETNVHATNIAIISALGITANTDTFNPKGLVTRGQMASFLVRAHMLLGVTFPADPTSAFVDVPGTTHDENIAKLEAVGLVEGVTATMYEPDANVSRGATATLLARSAQVLEDNGLWDALLPGANNQSFAVSVSTTQFFDTDGASANERITFSGLDTTATYDVALLPCGGDDSDGDQSAVVFSDGEALIGPGGDSRLGQISFLDQDGGTFSGQPDDKADHLGETQFGDIYISDLDDDGSDEAYEDEVSPRSNGTIEVDLVVGADQSDCAIIVVFEDHNDNDALDLGDENENTLENDNVPVADEPFAVSPAIVFHEGAASAGADPTSGETIVFMGDADLFGDLLPARADVGVVLENDYAGGSVFGLSFDDDRFYYQGSELDGLVDGSQVQDVLTIGDELEICDNDDECGGVDNTYAANSRTHWMLFDDDTDSVPARATNVVVTVEDLDDDGDSDDATVTWDAPVFTTSGGPGGHIDSYYVEIWDADNADGGPVDSLTTDEADILSDPTAAATMAEFDNLGAGTYHARVTPVTEAENDEQLASLWSAAFTVEGPAGPVITSATLETDAITVGLADAGDEWELVFDVTMDAIVDGDQVWVTDADGDLARIECDTDGVAPALGNTDATCVLSTTTETNDTLTITLDADAIDVNFAGDDDVTYPLTITATAGISASGVDVDLGNSTDLTIE